MVSVVVVAVVVIVAIVIVVVLYSSDSRSTCGLLSSSSIDLNELREPRPFPALQKILETDWKLFHIMYIISACHLWQHYDFALKLRMDLFIDGRKGKLGHTL